MSTETIARPQRRAMLHDFALEPTKVSASASLGARQPSTRRQPPHPHAPQVSGYVNVPVATLPPDLFQGIQNSAARGHLIYERDGKPGHFRFMGKADDRDQQAVFAEIRARLVRLLPGARVTSARAPKNPRDSHWDVDFTWTRGRLGLPIVRELRHMMFLDSALESAARDIPLGAQAAWTVRKSKLYEEAWIGLLELADLGNDPVFRRASDALQAATTHGIRARSEGWAAKAVPADAVATFGEVRDYLSGHLAELEAAIQAGATQVPGAESAPQAAERDAWQPHETETDRIYRVLGDPM